MSSHHILGAVGVVAMAAGGYLLWPRGEQAPTITAPQPVAQAPAAPKEPAKPAIVPLPTPQSAGIPVENCIHYPDGTVLPPLNGVKKAPQMLFHRLVPFAKVVRKEFDRGTGLEWYIHENGVRSTTRLQADGRAVAETDKPTQPAPVADDK